MTGQLVADTDLVIDFLRGQGDGARLLPDWLRTRRLRLTAVTLFELRSGRDWDARGPRIEPLFLGGPLPFDRAAALAAGDVEASLRRLGAPIGVADVQQAGICRSAGLPFATRNARHFDRVEDLVLVDISM